MQRPTSKHQGELEKSYGRAEDRIEQARGVKDSTEDLQSLVTWAHGGSETELPTKEHARVEPRSSTHL